MESRERLSFLAPFGHWKTSILRLHSRARGFLKNAKRHLSHARSLEFHQAFIKEGDLVFDIGANVGNLTALYLKLGARVVAVEPQDECLRSLEIRFGRHPRLTIVPMAVGSTQGCQEMMLSDIRSPISSMSGAWVAAVKSSGRFRHYEWSRTVTVPVTTLDALIAQYGEPNFCKIDVEGFEKEVLKGLSCPLNNLSFEFHAEFLPDANACLELLRSLGDYGYNYTIENQMVWELPRWVEEKEMSRRLLSLPFSSLQGDVYARRFV